MSVEETVKNIKKLHTALTAKNNEVTIIYRGTEYGTKNNPWLVRIDAHEATASTQEIAVVQLCKELEEELQKRIAFTASQAESLRSTLSEVLRSHNVQ